MADNSEKLGIDIFDDIDLQDFDLEFLDENFLDDIMLSKNLEPTCHLFEDIPADRKEWMVTDTTSKRRRPPRLYEFLLLLLQNPNYISYASYKNKSQGTFEVHAPDKVANLWQQIRNRTSIQPMTYEKFARAIRWYYKSNIMVKTNTRYTFQFSPILLRQLTIDDNNNVIRRSSSESQ